MTIACYFSCRNESREAYIVALSELSEILPQLYSFLAFLRDRGVSSIDRILLPNELLGVLELLTDPDLELGGVNILYSSESKLFEVVSKRLSEALRHSASFTFDLSPL